MNKPLALLLMAGLTLGFASTALAEGAKIGFVNVAQVVEKAPQAGAATKTLEREFSPRDNQVVSQQKELKQLEEKLARDAAIMSDAERHKLERDILSGKRRLKNAQDEFRADFNLRRNEELRKLQKLVGEVIQALGVLGVIGFLFVWGLKALELLPTEARMYPKPATETSPVTE